MFFCSCGAGNNKLSIVLNTLFYRDSVKRCFFPCFFMNLTHLDPLVFSMALTFAQIFLIWKFETFDYVCG